MGTQNRKNIHEEESKWQIVHDEVRYDAQNGLRSAARSIALNIMQTVYESLDTLVQFAWKKNKM